MKGRDQTMNDIICFHVFGNIYGVPLTMIEETFEEMRITKVPGLHEALIGLCNHNGVVYPVISFSKLCKQNLPIERICMLLLQVDVYHIILRMNDVPFVVYEDEMDSVVNTQEEHNGILINKICHFKDGTIYVLDMEKIIEEIAEYSNENM